MKSLFETLKLMAYSDPFLIEKRMDEIEGIILLCPEGLHRLSANNYRFTIIRQAKENVKATNNIYAGGKRVRGFVGIEVPVKHLL